MFAEILTKTYYGNTLFQYLLTFILIIAVVVLAKMAYWAIGKSIKRISRKSKNTLDDVLVDMLEEPLVFAIIITGIWYSLQMLSLSEGAESAFSTAYYVLTVFNVAWLVSRLIDALFENYVAPLVVESESKLDDQLIPIVQKGIRIGIWIMALLIALNNAGYNVGAVLASLGIGGIAFALAAKDTIANLFGSFTLFVDKPFAIGDRVVVKGYDGFVREIGIRSTRIQVLNGRMITIPNAGVVDEAIENISSEPSRKITLDLGLTYDTTDEQMSQAMDLLKEIAIANENLETKMVTAFTAFNDSSLNIRFIYYISKGKSVFDTQTAINLEILRRFNAAGFDFAFPTRTIYNLDAGSSPA